MKKLTIYLFLFFAPLIIVQAQYQSIFDTIQTAWKLNNCGLMNSCFEDSLVLKSGDTIINNKTYKKLGYFISISPSTSQEDNEYYVREELNTGKIWTISSFNSTEILISDLTLKVNDTFDFGTANGRHRVDSVYIENNKKVIRFDYDIYYQSKFIDKLKMIEGMGLNIGGCIEPQFTQIDLGNYVICQEKNYLINYTGNHPSSSCSSANVSVKKFNNRTKVAIHPNPASAQLFIETDNIKIERIEILNLQGKVLLDQPFSKTIDVSGFGTGVYLLKLYHQGGVINRKFQIR